MMARSLFSHWNVNQRLAALALVLGVVALFGDPYAGGTIRVNPKELARAVASGASEVTVHELADWIIRQRSDYRLLDLRDAEAVAAYHIPGAEPVALSALADYPLLRNEKIVLYGADDARAAHAWTLLRVQGFRGVYTLKGGLEAWKHQILFPAFAENAAAKEVEKARGISHFFGGSVQVGGEEVVAKKAVELPKVELPAASPVVARKKKPREGC